MKFELVGFYPITKKNFSKRDRHLLGTAHVYLVDCSLDLRGIRVTCTGKSLFYHLPHAHGIDGETGENVRYPLVRFTNDLIQQELIDFLRKSIEKEALDTLKVLKPLRDECKGPATPPKMKRQPDTPAKQYKPLKLDYVRNLKQ